jgi:hypothetical protein
MAFDRRAALLFLLFALGCSKTRSPEAVSKEFIDRYYIERDHAKALEVAEDGAAARIRSEQSLLAGAPAASGVLPRVFYNLMKQEASGDHTDLTYALTVDSGGVQLKKEVRLVVRKFGPQYKVSFFHERDISPR